MEWTKMCVFQTEVRCFESFESNELETSAPRRVVARLTKLARVS